MLRRYFWLSHQMTKRYLNFSCTQPPLTLFLLANASKVYFARKSCRVLQSEWPSFVIDLRHFSIWTIFHTSSCSHIFQLVIHCLIGDVIIFWMDNLSVSYGFECTGDEPFKDATAVSLYLSLIHI